MAKTKVTMTQAQTANARVYAAKHERRIEKSNYPPSRKLQTIAKLRDTAQSLRSATLVKSGKIAKT